MDRSMASLLLPFDQRGAMGSGYDFVWPVIARRLGQTFGIVDDVVMSLSRILCARHSMTIRSIYADQQDEVEERGDRGQVRGAAEDSQGTA
jgi:hypothetical protein